MVGYIPIWLGKYSAPSLSTQLMTDTKSATKLSKQAQNELWYEINNTEGKKKTDNASKIQEINNTPKINHSERKLQINNNAETQGDIFFS